MGHQFSRAVAATALAVGLAACGGSDGAGDKPPVLDIARDQVDEAQSDDESSTATSEPPSTAASTDDTSEVPTAPTELPAPDPSTFEGANRVINLWVGPDGETGPIDVWGRRTFTNGPILLAEGIEFATASEYFAAPAGYSLVIVGSGAGPDGEERAGLFNAADGEQISTVFTNDDDQGGVTAPNAFERGTDQSPEPPAAGTGLVVLFAPNVRAFADSLAESVGGDAFYVGDGSAVCRTQRIEATGAAPNILGGTQQVELELSPGPAEISLYPWFSPDECDQHSALDITLDVVAGETTSILVFSPDGIDIDAMVLPVPDQG